LPLEPGTHLGAYAVVSPLGAGGMGEVWRATDTRLGRDVALKLLPQAFASDPDRLARFEREAKVLASLNHPGIAHLYGFESVTLEDGSAEPRLLATETRGRMTGYYEPLLNGSRTRAAPFVVPLHRPPADLLTIDLSSLYPELASQRLRGRLQQSDKGTRVVPYWSRAELTEERLRGTELVWVDDAIEAFFLQVQGSGRVRLRDGSMIRVGYADTNGHPYRSIGRLLVDRGELTLEQASMQGITAWARANPKRVAEMLNENPSYVFFREVPLGDPNAGPVGALGVPLTPGYSVAVDPRFIPLGAPLLISSEHPVSGAPLRRLMLAQDTGGAIRGPLRFDFFWGFGAEAAAPAGRQRHDVQAWLLVPRGVRPEKLLSGN